MKKHFLFFFALALVAQMSWAVTPTKPADIPAYYNAVNGKSGKGLWDAVHSITDCKSFKSISYKSGLNSAYLKTDVYPADSVGRAGKIWDMYAECTFSPGNTCGKYDVPCDCWNKEHSIPQSYWGGGTSGIGCDIFHVVPTDGKINGVRSNYEYGIVGTIDTKTDYSNYNGNKLGSATSWSTDKATIASAAGEIVNGSGKVFEPNLQYKGDLARGIMGTIVKWEKNVTTSNQFFDYPYDAAHYFGLSKKAVVLLMKWHREDPVSRKEVDRNNGIQETQGNRNPFIDYPYLAEYIWGEHAGEAVDMEKLMPSTDPEFILGVSDGYRGDGDSPMIITPKKGTIEVGAVTPGESVYKDIIVQGVNLEDGDLTLAVSGENASSFSLSTSAISKTQAEAGYNVTITYAPTAAGSHSANLVINGCGITDYLVTLTGISTVMHTITWKDASQTQETQVVDNGALELPANTPAHCSETRVFRGWTATPNYEGDNAPADFFTQPSMVVTKPMTFYAVYADKQSGSGSSEEGSTTSIVMEKWTAVSGTFDGFVFEAKKGEGTNEPAYNATGKDGRVYAKGTLKISSSEAMTQIVFNLSQQGLKRLAPITASEGSIAEQAKGDAIVTWTGSATSVTFTVGDKSDYGSESKAGQLCFTSVDITTGGGGTPASYSNFSLKCTSEPIVDPDYTVTFYNNGIECATRVGHAGDEMDPVADPAAPCDRYTFEGWSTHQYTTETIEIPVLDFTNLIPEADIAYYAVFSCLVDQEASLSGNDYLKISSTQGLTSGNYLVVGEKEGFFAMSATFAGYYLRNAEVESYGNIISYPADSIIWNIAVDAENETLTFHNADAGYLYIEKSEKDTKTYYNIKLGDNTTDNKFKYALDAQTGGWIFTSATYTDRQLEYYSSKSYWTYYTKQDAPIALYQQAAEPVDIVLYTTAPWCSSTEIDFVLSNEPVARKVLIDGQIRIIRDNKVYNLQGVRIK